MTHLVLNVRIEGSSSTSSSFSCRKLGRGRRRKIRSEAATTRGASTRARAHERASYQFDNAHPLNGRRDGRGRSSVSNDVSSSVSFSSSISFTVRAPLTCPSREGKREIPSTSTASHELTRLTRDAFSEKEGEEEKEAISKKNTPSMLYRTVQNNN